MIRLIPRETKFFRMFADVSQNVTEGARLLHDILKYPANIEERLNRLQEIEHRGDDMTHAIITPSTRHSSLPLTAKTSTA